MTSSPGIAVSEVTDVDRRAAKRLGMDAEKVNLVINTWATEYLTYEREQSRLREATRAPAAAEKPAKTRRSTPKKTTVAQVTIPAEDDTTPTTDQPL